MTETIDITPSSRAIELYRKTVTESIEKLEEDLRKINLMYPNSQGLIREGLEMVEVRIQQDLDGLREALEELTPRQPLTPRERLRVLSKFLREFNTEEHKFEMNHWGIKEPDTELYACGTAACAAGWATTIPEFKAEGLKLVNDDGGDYYMIALEDPKTHLKTLSFEALEEFFDITSDVAVDIFGGGRYTNNWGGFMSVRDVTPEMVADKIDNYLLE